MSRPDNRCRPADPVSPIPRIIVTPGEPAGIGPDLCALIARNRFDCELVAVADPDLLTRRARKLGLELELRAFNPESPAGRCEPGQLKVLPVKLGCHEQAGQLNTKNARYVLETIKHATHLCLAGTATAMVTGPVHKGIINDAGISFSGHTEYLSTLTGGNPVMMLATPGLRVALITTHIPVSRISQSIDQPLLERVIRILHSDLRDRFHLQSPRIAVCGLNPHAGEGGHLGREEIDIICPALDRLREQGIRLQGPLPADTVFTPEHMRCADAIVAMYHDQGLPVLKHLGFGNAVNITLGLPIIRTSVDHGTALDLAGSGEICTGSLEYAIQTALEMGNTNQ